MTYNLVMPNGCGMITEHVQCLPTKTDMKRILDGGGKLYIDGKKVSKAEAVAVCLKEKNND